MRTCHGVTRTTKFDRRSPAEVCREYRISPEQLVKNRAWGLELCDLTLAIRDLFQSTGRDRMGARIHLFLHIPHYRQAKADLAAARAYAAEMAQKRIAA